jgi:CHAT domain-containing protein
VACHGVYCEDGPWSSGLRLGDAWVSLPDLYAMRGMARLVVLSGCETGRGTVYSGDEWVGLVRGFLQAGASSVVASLWEVHDRCTVSLMEDFYGGIAGGLPVAKALALAQRAARRRDSMPLRWAPFVVIGEPELRVPLRKVA